MKRRSFLKSTAKTLSLASAGSMFSGLNLGTAASLISSAHGQETKVPARKTNETASNALKLGSPKAFSHTELLQAVRERATKPYNAPPQVPKEWIDLDYDQYRGIRFKPEDALWRDQDHPFELHTFPPGLYFPSPIKISIVDGDQQRPVLFDRSHFALSSFVPDLPNSDTLNYSGFRILGPINSARQKTEFLVFQGASYFRALSKGLDYGLSARGLAINTGEAKGEEFPDFRHFWIEEPNNDTNSLTIHALLDSPSVAGLYSFLIKPGPSTTMDVKAHLFPRAELTHVGLGAQTSMFLFDETNRNRFDDFRPAVHDSDGLLIENGAGETLWRQLANPTSLQVSSFVDNNPRGFGLMQRPRHLNDFADLEAHYHNRPSQWVIPAENWGKGAVTLVEIPADREIYDNIVAYWRPHTPLAPGQEYNYNYRIVWRDKAPVTRNLAQAINTRMGKRFTGGRLVTVDFSPTDLLPSDLSKIALHVSSNKGTVSKGILQHNPATGGIRLAFTFDPKKATSVELRAQLMVNGKSVSEVWLYRWTI